MEEGLSAYASRNYSTAVTRFSQAITQDKKNASLYIYLGMALMQSGDLTAAKQQFETALSLSPANVQAQRGLALSAMRNADFPTAVSCFSEAISLAEKNGDTTVRNDCLSYRADAQAALGNYSDAVVDCRTLLDNSYETFSTQIRLGSFLLKKGEQQEALKAYQAALDENSHSFSAYLTMIEALSNAGMEREAQNFLEKALAEPADTAEDHRWQGILLYESGDTKKAFSKFELAYSSGDSEAGYWLGMCYEEQENYREAMRIFEQQAVTDPKNAAVYNQMAVCSIREERYTDAALFIDQGLYLAEPGSDTELNLLWNQAICLEKQKKYASAAEAFRKYLSKDPDDPAAQAEYEYSLSRQ